MSLHNFDKFLEAKLQISNDMMFRLDRIHNKANTTIKYLQEYGVDIPNLDINYLDSGEAKDMVTLMPEDRLSRISDAGGWEGDAWENKYRVSSKFGRAIRKILNAAKEVNPEELSNHISLDITDAEMEDYVNKFKSSNQRFDNIRVVNGDDIAFFYLADRYSDKDDGTLGDSCMRYPRCQHYLGIYTDNKEQVSMVILLDPDKELSTTSNSGVFNKILGRALVWTLDDGQKFMDRVYVNDSSDVDLFKEYAASKGWLCKGKQSYDNRDNIFNAKTGELCDEICCTLINHKFDMYPYVDSMKFYEPSTGKFASTYDGLSNYRKFDDTDGNGDLVWDDYNDCLIDRDEAVYCEYGEGYTDHDSACYMEYREASAFSTYVYYSEFENDYILKEDAVYSKYHNGYLRAVKSLPFYNWHINGMDSISKFSDDIVYVIIDIDESDRKQTRLDDDPNICEYGYDNWYMKGVFGLEVGDYVTIKESPDSTMYKVIGFEHLENEDYPFVDLGYVEEESEQYALVINGYPYFKLDDVTKVANNQLSLDLEKINHKYLNRYNH